MEDLAGLASAALTRRLARGPAALLAAASLFDHEEHLRLAESLAAATGTAEMLGRALVRDYHVRTLRRHGLLAEGVGSTDTLLHESLAGGAPVLAPERAVEYFKGLVPTLGTDPQRFGLDQRRRAFTLAAATDSETLARVQDAVRGRLAAGASADAGGVAVQAVLDQAGVTQASPGYAEMVYRTNAMDAFNQGAYEEMRHPDVAGTFPAWRYENPADGRSRKSHAERDGRLYAAAVPFVTVRGTDAASACNCRCTFTPIDRWDLEDLLAGGAVLLQAA